MYQIKEVFEEIRIKQIRLAGKLGKSYKVVNVYDQNRQQPTLNKNINE